MIRRKDEIKIAAKATVIMAVVVEAGVVVNVRAVIVKVVIDKNSDNHQKKPFLSICVCHQNLSNI